MVLFIGLKVDCVKTVFGLPTKLYQELAGKSGNDEKESELEDILLGDDFERFEVMDCNDQQFRLTENRWQRYSRLLKQYEGWASALRAAHGHDMVTFLEESQILDEQVDQRGGAGGAAGPGPCRRTSPTRPCGLPSSTDVGSATCRGGAGRTNLARR